MANLVTYPNLQPNLKNAQNLQGFMPTAIFQFTSVTQPVKIDITRMNKALSAKSVIMPKGLSRAERHQFLLNRAKAIQ